MSLVRCSFAADHLNELKKKIRHAYDLHMMLQHIPIADFFQSLDFEIMIKRVAQDDIIGYKNNNQWLLNHPKSAPIFGQAASVWKVLIPTYEADFKPLVYGFFPSESAIFDTINLIGNRLEGVTWDISFG